MEWILTVLIFVFIELRECNCQGCYPDGKVFSLAYIHRSLSPSIYGNVFKAYTREREIAKRIMNYDNFQSLSRWFSDLFHSFFLCILCWFIFLFNPFHSFQIETLHPPPHWNSLMPIICLLKTSVRFK